MPIRSTARSVLLSLRDSLATFLEWEPSRIIITAMPPSEVPHTIQPSDILLAIKGEARNSADPDGGGRYVSRRKRRLQVVCRAHMGLDAAGADLNRLTADSVGLLALEDAVFDVIENRFALDADGNGLALPFVCGDFTDPERDQGNEARNRNWVSSKLDVSFEYLRDLTLPEMEIAE